MATNHTVKPGEYLAKIAAQYGFRNYSTIWDHPNNAALKEQRENPNVLMPGDTVYIPNKEQKQVIVATTQRHRFQVATPKILLRVALKNFDDQPLADTECELQVEGKTYHLTTDSDGLIEQEIPATAENAGLTFTDPMIPLDIQVIKIGHLDPVEENSGQRARLSNLGYYLGSLDNPSDDDEAQLRVAIEEFQCDNGLPATGAGDFATQAKLAEVHGS
jgi:hypothetical protein